MQSAEDLGKDWVFLSVQDETSQSNMIKSTRDKRQEEFHSHANSDHREPGQNCNS